MIFSFQCCLTDYIRFPDKLWPSISNVLWRQIAIDSQRLNISIIPDRDDDEEGEDDQAHVEGLQFLAERDMRSLHRVSVRAANDPSVFTITRPSLMSFASASQFP